MPYAGLKCDCCGGETDGNGDCPNYCEPEWFMGKWQGYCPCPNGQKRAIEDGGQDA